MDNSLVIPGGLVMLLAVIAAVVVVLFIVRLSGGSMRRSRAGRRVWSNRLSRTPRPRYGEFWQKMKRTNVKKRHDKYWKKRYPDDKPQSFYSDRR